MPSKNFKPVRADFTPRQAAGGYYLDEYQETT